MENLSTGQRAKILETYYQNNRSNSTPRRAVLREFGINVTDVQIHRLQKHFSEKNTIDPMMLKSRKGNGRRKDEDHDKTLATVLVSLLHDPKLSLRRRSRILEISTTSLTRAIKEVGFRAYKVRSVQQLKPADYQLRLNFSNWALQKRVENPNIIIIFTDEAKFFLNGVVSSCHAYHYSSENPHEYVEQPLDKRGVMAWAAMTSERLIGPFFFDENVNQESYMAMLQEHLVPALELPDLRDALLYFMQDGAGPHRAREVLRRLLELFGDRLIALGANIPWPPRSPDLTPCDFFLWGYLKQMVYRQSYNTIEELKLAIAVAAQSITRDMLQRTFLNFYKRLHICVERQGKHVEPFL